MAWDDIDWSKPDLPKNPPPVPEPKKEKRIWDGVDASDRTHGKCKTCGSSPENISATTGNCWDCDDDQPRLFDPTQIHGRSIHSSLTHTEAGLKDMADWISEKGLDADAAIHKRIYPDGCPSEDCWVCHEGERPVGFQSQSAHESLVGRSRFCPYPKDRQWDCPLCNTGEPHPHGEEQEIFT